MPARRTRGPWGLEDRQTDNLEAGEAAVILDVHAVRRYLDGHATDDALTIARVAAVFGFSREHLSLQFAGVFGVSPHAYLSQLRLRQIFAAWSEGLKVERSPPFSRPASEAARATIDRAGAASQVRA